MADIAIADYDTLIAEVKTWCARSDSTFSSRFPLFISLTENRIYNGHGQPGEDLYSAPLRTSIMEKSSTITMSTASGTQDSQGDLPSDFLEARSIFRTGDPTGLVYMPPAQWDIQNASAIGGSYPYYYTTKGSKLYVTPGIDGDLTLAYFCRFDPISLSNKNGALLAEHGALYFGACMLYAFSFMRDVQNAAMWLSEYRATIDGLNRTAHAKRRGAQAVRMYARPIG